MLNFGLLPGFARNSQVLLTHAYIYDRQLNRTQVEMLHTQPYAHLIATRRYFGTGTASPTPPSFTLAGTATW
jgi:hypothetical protein